MGNHRARHEREKHRKVREVLMGVGDGVASVIMLTFTKRPGPHAHFYKEAGPPCSLLQRGPHADTAWAVIG